MTRELRALSFLASALAFAAPAAAQNATPSPSPDETLRTSTRVEVEATTDDETLSLGPLGRTTDLMKTPFSLSIVSNRTVRESGARQLSDAVTGASSVNTVSGFGIFDLFYVRGFESLANGLVMIDGVREPESTFLPAYSIERVEILRGPSGFVAGPDASTASINVLRKQPKAGRFAGFGARYGSFASYDVDADLGVSNDDSTFSARLPGFVRGSDGWRDRENSQWGLNPGIRVVRPNGLVLVANYERLRSEFLPDVGIPLVRNAVPNVADTSVYQSPFDYSEQDLDRFRVRVEKPIGSNSAVKNLAYYTRLQWLSDGTLPVGAFNIQGFDLTARTLTMLDDEQRLMGNRLWFETTRTGSNRTQKLSVGAEAYRMADDYGLDVGLLPPMIVARPVETATRPVPLIPGQSLRAEARNTVLSAFASSETTWNDRVQTLAGMRFDSFGFNEDNYGIDKSWTKFSPFAGVNVGLSGKARLFASYSKGFTPPSTLVLGSREPEKTRQFEAGLKLSDGARGLRGTISAYELRRENVTIPDGSGLPRPTGDQRSRGFEVEAGVDRSRGGVAVSYAYTEGILTDYAETGIVGFDPATFQPRMGTLDRSGNDSPFAPRHLFSLRGRLDLGRGVLVSAAFRANGAQFIAEDNAFAIPSARFLDAAVSYGRGRARVTVFGDNLLDEKTYTRGYSSYSVLPVPSRRFSVRLEVR
jgi:outer membrane receptor protein involved in Fe transport